MGQYYRYVHCVRYLTTKYNIFISALKTALLQGDLKGR